MTISQPQTLLFRIIARTAYDTATTKEYSEELVLDYYNKPSLSGLMIDRKSGSYTVSGTVKAVTSIPNSIRQLTLSVKNADTEATKYSTAYSLSGVNEYKFKTPDINAAEPEFYNVQAEIFDTLSSSLFYTSSPVVSGTVILPRYSALFTIREKGIGINAIANEQIGFAANASFAINGKDTAAISSSDATDFYVGAYLDTDGKVKASYDNMSGQIIQHYRLSRSGAMTGMQRRYMTVNTNTPKGTDINFPAFGTWSSWVSVMDSNNSLDIVYPVGSIYFSVNSENPTQKMGGTWAAWGSGCVPVGVDGSSDFDSVEKPGGSKSSVASHTHDFSTSSTTKTLIGNVWNVARQSRDQNISTTGIFSGPAYVEGVGYAVNMVDSSNDGFTLDARHEHSGTTVSTGTANGNLQPYITCYMWKRTA